MKKAVIILVVLSVFLLSFPITIPGSFQSQEVQNLVEDKDVIIIFNSGGWGNTPLDKAYDFAPIIEKIQGNLNNLGYSSAVIPFFRTKPGFWGKVSGTKDFLSSFRYSSDDLAKTIKLFSDKFPDKKIIVTGLSGGAGLVSEAMDKLSGEISQSVLAIIAGPPFWSKPSLKENILCLDNDKMDILTVGNVKILLSLVKDPIRLIIAKIKGENMTFTGAFYLAGHQYRWESQAVGPKITAFLSNNLQ